MRFIRVTAANGGGELNDAGNGAQQPQPRQVNQQQGQAQPQQPLNTRQMAIVDMYNAITGQNLSYEDYQRSGGSRMVVGAMITDANFPKFAMKLNAQWRQQIVENYFRSISR